MPRCRTSMPIWPTGASLSKSGQGVRGSPSRERRDGEGGRERRGWRSFLKLSSGNRSFDCRVHDLHILSKCSIATGAVHLKGVTWASVHGALRPALPLLHCFSASLLRARLPPKTYRPTTRPYLQTRRRKSTTDRAGRMRRTSRLSR